MNCKNCDQIVDGNFCTHCGQSTKVGRINFPNFLSELSESIFQINKGFFYSLTALFVRPGQTIKEYLNGKRKNHFKPIAYAFTLSTIYFLLSQFVESETVFNNVVAGWSNASSEPEVETSQLAILNWFAENYAYTMLMLLPIYSLASYLSFLGVGYNYLEHFVLNAYITGQQAIFYSLSAILGSFITDEYDIVATITLCISVIYAIIVFWNFFSEQSRFSVIFRLILTYVLYLIMPLVVLLIIFLVLR